MLTLLSYDFFLRALLGVVLTGIVTGILGSYIVARRMVFITGGITHSSFAGLGLGFFLGQSPFLYALFASVLSGVGVEYLSQKGNVREDSAIATVWSFGMALGVLFTFLTPGYTPGLSSFLFGNILLISSGDLWGLGGFLLLLIPLLYLYYQPLLFVSFDPLFAQTRGLPVSLFRYGMIIFICIGIVLSIRVLGIMMLMSMLTLPQMTTSLFTNRLKYIIWGSTLLSVFSGVLSLLVSYYLNLPSGAVSVLLLSLFYFLLKTVLYLRSAFMYKSLW